MSNQSVPNKTNSVRKSQQKLFIEDAISGFLAGFLCGIPVSLFEYLKVSKQIQADIRIRDIMKQSKSLKNSLKSMLPFSLIFGTVCALEFSVNDRLKKTHGKFAGICASAVTGSGLLTLADHIMLRRHHNEHTLAALTNLFRIKWSAPWTGFTPMMFRQAIFITSVLYMGPSIGTFLKSYQNAENDQPHWIWNVMGRFISGLMTTSLSQPFDSITREMQKRIYIQQKSQSPLQCALEMHQNFMNNSKLSFWSHPFYLGGLPRLVLATFGGMMAGGIYEEAKLRVFGTKQQ